MENKEYYGKTAIHFENIVNCGEPIQLNQPVVSNIQILIDARCKTKFINSSSHSQVLVQWAFDVKSPPKHMKHS